ncbi:hypothetical protein ACIBW9_41320 [Streptomyces sp. NPDC049541]
MLVLPVPARLLSGTSWSEPARRRIVAAATGCYGAAAIGTGVWAVLTY